MSTVPFGSLANILRFRCEFKARLTARPVAPISLAASTRPPPKFLSKLFTEPRLLSTQSTSTATANPSTMLCTRCLRATIARRPFPIARQFSAAARFRSAEAPLSTPVTEPGQAPSPAPEARSVCIEGTVITGLNYLNGGKDPVAKKDEEYPDWLWSCLNVEKAGADDADPDAGDEFGMSHAWISHCIYVLSTNE